MTVTPVYQERPVPTALQGAVRRIMRVAIDGQDKAIIPARPTGCTYIGWFAQGTGTATANGLHFELTKGQVHLSGQLSTFDAEFTLNGPCIQYLAELTPDAMYRFLKTDVGMLCNRIETRDGPVVSGLTHDETFAKVLMQFQDNAGPTHHVITQAAIQIEEANGDVSIAALAGQSGMTDRQFRRLFSKVVGLSPKAYANIRRVLFALRLMAEEPKQGIADVANSAGFYDQSHLTRAFQQYLRATPAKLAFGDDGVLRSIVAGA